MKGYAQLSRNDALRAILPLLPVLGFQAFRKAAIIAASPGATRDNLSQNIGLLAARRVPRDGE